MVKLFKACSYKLVLEAAAMLQSRVGTNFRSVYGIGANQNRKLASDL